MKNLPAMWETRVRSLGREDSGEGNGYPLWYSSLEISMDRGARQATVHGIPKSWTWLRDFHFYFHKKTFSKTFLNAAVRVDLIAHLAQSDLSAQSLSPHPQTLATPPPVLQGLTLGPTTHLLTSEPSAPVYHTILDTSLGCTPGTPLPLPKA